MINSFFWWEGMLLQGGSDMNLKGPRRKKKRMVDNSPFPPPSRTLEIHVTAPLQQHAFPQKETVDQILYMTLNKPIKEVQNYTHM